MPNMDEVVRQERAEARKALEAATQGKWWHFDRNESIVCDATEPSHTRKNIADILSHNHSDTHLIANAPTWLRNALERERLLIEEREQDKADIEQLKLGNYDRDKAIAEICDARDEELSMIYEQMNEFESKVAEQDKEIQKLKDLLHKYL